LPNLAHGKTWQARWLTHYSSFFELENIMRIRNQLAIAATALFAASAGAAPASAPASASASSVASEAIAPIMPVQTIGAPVYRIPTPDAAALAGSYGLSTGETLRVSYERSRLYAELGERRTELVPVDGTSFAARGGGLRLRFDQVPFATDVVVSGR
jgi:hypothetical protein